MLQAYDRLSPHERTLASERYGERLAVPTVAMMLLRLSFKVEGVMMVFGILGAATAAAGFALLPVVLGTILNHIARSCEHLIFRPLITDARPLSARFAPRAAFLVLQWLEVGRVRAPH